MGFKKKKVLAIDFDGVIHDYKNPIPGRRMGGPIKGTKETLIYFKNKGYKIIVFSIWGDEEGKKTISDFMSYYKLPFTCITNIKPNADYYIDDKAIHFNNWVEVRKEIW